MDEKMKWGVKKFDTWEFPWVEFVEINLCYDGYWKRCRSSFSFEVVNNEFFIGRVESETWW